MATCLKCGIWHHGECEEVPDVSKLPAWPEKPECNIYGNEALDYVRRERDAYRARMEALLDTMKALDRVASGQRDYDVSLAREVSALLAACERRTDA